MITSLKNKTSYIFLTLSAVLIIIALSITISDNPPGVILTYLASLFFILAFTHSFEKPKSYLIFLVGTILLFILSIILQNLLESIGKDTFLEPIGIFFFLIAVFLCPAGILIGILGTLVKVIKK